MTIYCANCGKLNPPEMAICEFCKLPLIRYTDDGTLTAGTVINERFRIDEVIKIGGMGAVYRGFDINKKRTVAIKELYINLSNEEEEEDLIARFEREAELLSKLSHPNLPLVSDYFYDYDNYFMIMDFIEGQDLECILGEEGNPGLPEDKVLEWSIQLCSVLDYLHSHDPPILYRDLKPSNIMIRTDDNRAMLVDFGIARELSPGITSAHTVIGTIGYSPPEQFEGRQKPQSDIYALGATLHHLLSGKYPDIPFRFEALCKLNPAVSKDMERIVMKAIEMEIGLRFNSALDMREALFMLKEPEGRKTREKRKIVNEEKEKRNKAQSKVHSRRGMIYAKQGYYERAKEEFKKAVDCYQYSSEEYSNLGYTCLKLKDYENGEKYFLKALELEPNLAAAHSNLGVIYTRRGELEKGTEEFKKALRLNPKLVEAHINLADIYGKKNMYEEMLKECEKAIKLKPDCIEAYINFAYGCGKLLLHEEGIKKLNKALLIDTSDAFVYSNLGVLHGDIKQYNKAIKFLNKAISINPFLAEAHSSLGAIYYNTGEYNASKDSFKRALELDRNCQTARTNLARICSKIDFDIYEKKEVMKLLKPEPEKIKPPEEVAPAYISPPKAVEVPGKKYAKSVKKVVPVAAATGEKDIPARSNIPYTPEEFIELGKSYISSGKIDDAVKYFQHSLRLKPEQAEPHYNMGLAYEKKGMTYLAEGEYRDALGVDPSHLGSVLKLGQILYNNKALGEAMELYRAYLLKDRNTPEIYYRMGLIYKEQKEYKKAFQAFEDARARGFDEADNYFNLGFVCYEMNEDEDAEYYLKSAISRHLDSPGAHLYLGNIYYKSRKLNEARHHYQKAIEISPDYATAHSNLGAVYSDLNMLDQAEKAYFEAIELDPTILEVHRNLGVLYQKKGEFSKAIEEMKLYLNSSPDLKDRKEISKRIKDMEFVLFRRGFSKLKI